MADQNDTTLPVLTHILGLFTGFLGPLVVFFISADDDNAKAHAKAALNWQISLVIYSIVSIILIFIVVGFVLLIVLSVLNLVFSIMAAIRASKNELYNYPMTIKFLK